MATITCAGCGLSVKLHAKSLCRPCYKKSTAPSRTAYMRDYVRRPEVKAKNALLQRTPGRLSYIKDREESTAGRYAHMRKGAKRRGLEFTVSLEEYAQLLSGSACHYCQGPLARTGGGMDRVDNLLGYVPGNLVACCYGCNRLKSDILSYSEMVAVVKLLKTLRGAA